MRKGESGVYIRSTDDTTYSLSIPVGNLSSIYRAKLQAINAVIQLVQRGDRVKNIAVLTDSLSAIQSLESGPTQKATRQMNDSLQILSQHNNMVLQWIPAHMWIKGNETADHLAKIGSQLPQPPTYTTTYRELKSLLKNHFSS